MQVDAGQQISEAEVKQWMGDGLAAFKVPSYVDIQGDNLRRDACGKLLMSIPRGEGEFSFEETT